MHCDSCSTSATRHTGSRSTITICSGGSGRWASSCPSDFGTRGELISNWADSRCYPLMHYARTPMPPEYDADAERSQRIGDSCTPYVQLASVLVELHQR